MDSGSLTSGWMGCGGAMPDVERQYDLSHVAEVLLSDGREASATREQPCARKVGGEGEGAFSIIVIGRNARYGSRTDKFGERSPATRAGLRERLSDSNQARNPPIVPLSAIASASEGSAIRGGRLSTTGS